jgi:hypothetical protein
VATSEGCRTETKAGGEFYDASDTVLLPHGAVTKPNGKQHMLLKRADLCLSNYCVKQAAGSACVPSQLTLSRAA